MVPLINSVLVGGKRSASTLWLFYTRGKSRSFPVNGRLRGLHSRSVWIEEQQNPWFLLEIKSRVLGRPTSSLDNVWIKPRKYQNIRKCMYSFGTRYCHKCCTLSVSLRHLLNISSAVLVWTLECWSFLNKDSGSIKVSD